MANDYEYNDTAICYGSFDMLHPGHFRILKYAKKNSSRLVVVVNNNNDTKHSVKDRVNMVSEIGLADQILSLENTTLDQVIKTVMPKFFIVGREFKDVRKGEISNVESLLSQHGGKIKYYNSQSSDESASVYKNINEDLLNYEILEATRSELCLEKDILINIVERFETLTCSVIGDIILDRYIQTVPIGVSSEAPVMVVNQLSSELYIGGAAIVGRHLAEAGAKVNLLSVSGMDEEAAIIRQKLKRANVNCFITEDNDRPTTLKTRYLVGEQKLFRVSRLTDVPISPEIEVELFKNIEKTISKSDHVIFSDFSYGLLSTQVMHNFHKMFSQYHYKISGDSQTGSQVGDLQKFFGINSIFPTEKEARSQLNDKHSTIETVGWHLLQELKSDHIFLKLGGDGLLVFSKENQEKMYIPAFANKAIDVSGAGDALLSIASLTLSIDRNPKYAAFLGSIAAAIAINNLGNKPVQKHQIINILKELS
jgi:rfaE bifunctional protein kinase chain/domain